MPSDMWTSVHEAGKEWSKWCVEPTENVLSHESLKCFNLYLHYPVNSRRRVSLGKQQRKSQSFRELPDLEPLHKVVASICIEVSHFQIDIIVKWFHQHFTQQTLVSHGVCFWFLPNLPFCLWCHLPHPVIQGFGVTVRHRQTGIKIQGTWWVKYDVISVNFSCNITEMWRCCLHLYGIKQCMTSY